MNTTRTFRLQALRLGCSTCGFEKQTWIMPEGSYGYTFVHSFDGQVIGFAESGHDSTLEEVLRLSKDVAAARGQTHHAIDVFNVAYGMSCDPIEGTNVGILSTFCLRCHSEYTVMNLTHPFAFGDVDVKMVSHKQWHSRTHTEKLEAIHCALKESKRQLSEIQKRYPHVTSPDG